MKPGIEPLLSQTSFFRGLSAENRRLVAQICARQDMAKKTILFREGERGISMFLLARGTVQLFKTAEEGKDIVIKMVKAGEIFAEVILFEKDLYPVTATALIPSTVYAIPKKKFLALLGREDFRNDFLRILLEKQRYLAAQIVSRTSLDTEERFFRFLLDQCGPLETLLIPWPKKDLAAAIGTTPETFSRLLGKLRGKNLFDPRKRTLHLPKKFWEKYS
jgi:CRP-like cAMP-binding protein